MSLRAKRSEAKQSQGLRLLHSAIATYALRARYANAMTISAHDIIQPFDIHLKIEI